MHPRPLSALALCLALHAQAGAQSLPLRSAVGTNLDGLAAHSPQLPFADVMKSSAAWISGDAKAWSNGNALELDARGEVRALRAGQLARTLMLREIGTRYPAGRYRVRYEGEGRLAFGFAARVVSARPGDIVLEVRPESGGIHLMVEHSDPRNPLRRISVTLPGGTCAGDPFRHVAAAADCGAGAYRAFADTAWLPQINPAFLERLRGYSVLRFVDWMRTNNSALARWADRPRPEDARWTGDAGAPIEAMLAIANASNAHAWFTIPHLADDEFVERFALLVREQLRPGLGVYVEHSNEVWNAQFAQYRHAAQQGKRASPPVDAMEYHALRTRQIGAVFARVLGRERVVVVLGAQAGNPWTAEHPLERLARRFGRSGLGVDAVAIAPYLGSGPDAARAPLAARLTLDELFRQMREEELPKSVALMRAHRRIATGHGLALLAYEGGQHLAGVAGGENHEPLNVLYDAFNRDPRIRGLYLEYLEAWKRTGGELFVHYTDIGRFTKWGRWGALEHLAQPRAAAPKFDALHTFLEANPPWWARARGIAPARPGAQPSQRP